MRSHYAVSLLGGSRLFIRWSEFASAYPVCSPGSSAGVRGSAVDVLRWSLTSPARGWAKLMASTISRVVTVNIFPRRRACDSGHDIIRAEADGSPPVAWSRPGRRGLKGMLL